MTNFKKSAPIFIDTHAHLNFNAYKKDLGRVVERTLNENIWVINIGSKYETSKRAVEIAENYSAGIYSAVGLHPIHAKTGLVKIKTDPEEGSFETAEEELDREKYRALAKSEKVKAIGEIGFDYYYKPKTTKKKEIFKEKQRQVFLEQLDLAEELKLPIILHCRMAHDELITELKKKQFGFGGVLHCFTGSVSDARRYFEMGFYLGFNGIIFKLNLDEVIKKCPLDKILIETDCPYLTPPQEGKKRNEPIFIKHVAEKIAAIKKEPFEKISEKIIENTRKVFDI